MIPEHETTPSAAADEAEEEDDDDVRPELELKPFDWADLEARFGAQMEACDGEEESVGKEFAEWVEVCGFFLGLCFFSAFFVCFLVCV